MRENKNKGKKHGHASTNLLVSLRIINHILVGIGLGIDTSLGAFNGQSEGVHDDDGIAVGLALHETHDFDSATRASMDNHLEKGKGGNLNALEVVGVVNPRLASLEFGLGGLVVVEDGVGALVGAGSRRVHGDDIVLKLPGLLSDHSRGGGKLHVSGE